MRILSAGDIHGDPKKAEALADRAEKENVDLVILAGDLTHAEQSTEGLIGPFVKKNKKVLLVPGNHESIATADFLAELYGAKNIHGYSVKYKDVGFFGCSGVNIGIHQISEKEIFDLLEQGFNYVKDSKVRIMVTHVHPANSVMAKFSKLVPGSEGVRKAIDMFQPDILICSHVHEAEGLEEKIGNTKVINVGGDGKILDV